MNPSTVKEKQHINIYDLSDELLVEIAESVKTLHLMEDAPHPSHHVQKSLSSLSRASRRFHQVVEPVLYGGFVQIGKVGEQAPYQLITFMRTVLKRPDLARRVRTFQGTAISTDFSPGADVEYNRPSVLVDPIYTVQDLERLRATVTSTSGHVTDNDDATNWFEDIKEGSWDAIAALVLSQLENLDHLHLGRWNGDFGFVHMEKLLMRTAIPDDRPLEAPLTLTKLKCVTLLNPVDRYGMDFGSLLPFLALKTLTTFTAHSLTVSELWVVEEDNPWLKGAFKNANISSLALRDSAIDASYMMQFLGGFTKLQQLFIEFGPEGMDYTIYEPPTYLATIQHLKPCLRRLTFCCIGTSSDTGFEDYPIGSLADFEKLEEITAPACTLIGIGPGAYEVQPDEYEGTPIPYFKPRQTLLEALPKSIRSVTMQDCVSYTVEPLFDLISNIDQFPVLKTLDIGWRTQNKSKSSTFSMITAHPGFTKEQAEDFYVRAKAVAIEIPLKYERPVQTCETALERYRRLLARV